MEMLSLNNATPMRGTITVFSCLIAFAFARTLPAMAKWYRWFEASGLEISKHRGFGQSAGKAFGWIPNPPALSNELFLASGISLVASLLLSCSNLAPAGCLVASLVLYWLYMGQLYCEAHVGSHVTVLIPPMLLVALASPCGLAAEEAGRVPLEAQMLPLFVLKAVLTTAYASAGFSKLWASIREGVFWGNGSTLQYYCLEALFFNRSDASHGGVPHSSFGVPTPYSYHLQRFLVRHPRLCAVMSVKSLLFEAAAPVVLFYPEFGVPFAVAGVGFHYGIALFQNIDFFSWWGPFYVLFAFEDPVVYDNGIGNMINASFSFAPVGTALCLAYLAAHVLVMPWAAYHGPIDILPFSSFHMFSDPKNMWDPARSKSWWLTTKEHATGTLKHYAFPFARKQHVTVEEMPRLPFKYLFVGSHPERSFGNVDVTPKLTDIIDKMRAEWTKGAEHYLNAESIERMLCLLEDAKAEFATTSRAAQKEEPAKGPVDQATADYKPYVKARLDTATSAVIM